MLIASPLILAGNICFLNYCSTVESVKIVLASPLILAGNI